MRSAGSDLILFGSSKSASAILTLIQIPILASLAGQRLYGEYILLMSGLMLLASLFTSWIPATALRFFNNTNKVELLLFSWRSITWSSLVCSLALFLYISLLAENLNLLFFPLGILWIVSNSIFEFKLSLARASLNHKIYGMLVVARPLFILISLILACTLFKLSAIGLTSAAVLGTLLAALISIVSSKVAVINDVEASEELSLQRVLAYGVPAALVGFSTTVQSVAARYVISFHLGVEEAGAYSAIQDIIEKSIFFVNTIFLTATSARAMAIYDRSGHRASIDYLQLVMNYYVRVATPLCVFLLMVGPLLPGSILPDFFAVASPATFWLVCSGFLIGVLHRYTLILSLQFRSDLNLVGGLVAALVSVISSFFLVPLFGVSGGAAGAFLGSLSWLIIVLYFLRFQEKPEFNIVFFGIHSILSAIVFILFNYITDALSLAINIKIMVHIMLLLFFYAFTFRREGLRYLLKIK